MNRIISVSMSTRNCDPYDSESTQTGGVSQNYRVGVCGVIHTRPPTLEECEVVIKKLKRKNSQQARELLQIKAELRAAYYSHRWTPGPLLMARACVREESHRKSSRNTQG